MPGIARVRIEKYSTEVQHARRGQVGVLLLLVKTGDKPILLMREVLRWLRLRSSACLQRQISMTAGA